jgi:hypothetical protein
MADTLIEMKTQVERGKDNILELMEFHWNRRRARSQSCPFCRDNLKRVNSADLWMFTDGRDVVDMATITRDNLRRLFSYIEKLPLVIPDSVLESYDSHVK